jgi:hypothetical protein
MAAEDISIINEIEEQVLPPMAFTLALLHVFEPGGDLKMVLHPKKRGKERRKKGKKKEKKKELKEEKRRTFDLLAPVIKL